MEGLSPSDHAEYADVGFVQILNREIVRKPVGREIAPRSGDQSKTKKPTIRTGAIFAVVLCEKK